MRDENVYVSILELMLYWKKFAEAKIYFDELLEFKKG